MIMVLSVRPHIRRIFTGPTIARTRYNFLASETSPDQLDQNTHFANHGDILEVNSQLKRLTKTGHLDEAREVFDKMPHRDEVSWTTMMSGYVNASDSSEALILLSNMWVQPGLRMDPFVLSLALKACGLGMKLYYAEILHGCSVKTGLFNSVFVGSSLLDMYMKVGEIGKSCKVFDEMPARNVVSWTAIMTGLVRGGYIEEGLFYFSEMQRLNVECDSYAFAIALKACADSKALNHGREIHARTMKQGFDDSSFVVNSLATMYNKCGKLEYGLCLFKKMNNPDVVSWTTIITTYVQTGRGEHAMREFARMREYNVCPNEYTYAAVISACSNIARIQWGRQLHALVLCIGLIDSLSVANSIMTMYSRCGELPLASAVFSEMTVRDIISWSTIIAAYTQGGYGEEAFEYLSLMRRKGPKPNEFAFASVLSACGSMASLEQGKQLHAHVLSIGLEHSEMIQSALINMYSKSGSIKEALKIFNSAINSDIISWTAMINGYAEHGYSQEAINLFEKIRRAGLRPDSVTFIGVLTACSHAGLVDLGFHYFDLMSKQYLINPSKEHYGCIIDLLCRAGRLNDAEQMIRSMPFQQDDVVWSTLLRACRVHGDVDRGRRAAEEILRLDPNCAGTYITLANIYASKGKWREAANERKIMRSKRVIKEPGWSWIKVKDTISAFVAGDKRHPQGEDIFNMLELLASKIETSSHEMGTLLNEVEE